MILNYSVRSILAQRSSSLIAFAVLGATTSIVTVLFGLTEGLVASARNGGDARTAVVLTEGGDEGRTHIDPPTVDRVRVIPGVSSDGGGPLVSPEMVARLPILEPSGKMDLATLRGVEPTALAVHPKVQVRGRLPNRGEEGVVIGARQVGRHPGFVEGGRVRFGRYEWPVLGVLTAEDSVFESEIWGDRTFLRQALKQESDNVVYARLNDASAQAGFSDGIKALRGSNLRGLSESGYYAERVKELALYFDAIYVILFILVTSMVLTGANTIYTSFLARVRELATLMAIGFTRRRVMAMMTVESVLITSIGGLIGMGLAATFNGHRFSLDEIGMVYSVQLTPRVLGLGVTVALVTGLISSLVANIQISRIQVLNGLRE